MGAILTFMISPVGRMIGLVLAVLSLLGAAYLKGHHDGYTHERDKWVAAEQAAVAKGQKARADALRSVSRSPEPGRLYHDRFNRD